MDCFSDDPSEKIHQLCQSEFQYCHHRRDLFNIQMYHYDLIGKTSFSETTELLKRTLAGMFLDKKIKLCANLKSLTMFMVYF